MGPGAEGGLPAHGVGWGGGDEGQEEGQPRLRWDPRGARDPPATPGATAGLTAGPAAAGGTPRSVPLSTDEGNGANALIIKAPKAGRSPGPHTQQARRRPLPAPPRGAATTPVRPHLAPPGPPPGPPRWGVRPFPDAPAATCPPARARHLRGTGGWAVRTGGPSENPDAERSRAEAQGHPAPDLVPARPPEAAKGSPRPWAARGPSGPWRP